MSTNTNSSHIFAKLSYLHWNILQDCHMLSPTHGLDREKKTNCGAVRIYVYNHSGVWTCPRRTQYYSSKYILYKPVSQNNNVRLDNCCKMIICSTQTTSCILRNNQNMKHPASLCTVIRVYEIVPGTKNLRSAVNHQPWFMRGRLVSETRHGAYALTRAFWTDNEHYELTSCSPERRSRKTWDHGWPYDHEQSKTRQNPAHFIVCSFFAFFIRISTFGNWIPIQMRSSRALYEECETQKYWVSEMIRSNMNRDRSMVMKHMTFQNN